MIGIGLVGYGYWGPNLARNFAFQPDCKLVSICELSPERAQRAGQHYPGVAITPDYRALLDDPRIDAIAIATPAHTHYALAKQGLLAGKDILVEKPITQRADQAEELIQIADQNGRVLAVDHTFLYSGAVQKIKEIVDSGLLGDILYIDSVRVNLGLFQEDVNVIQDLAPHDLAIVCHLFSQDPHTVHAVGACHSGNGLENLAYLHLEYANNLIAHFHLNWLAPVKIRRMLIGGTRKMIVYDDMEPSEKLKIYDKGIVLSGGSVDAIHRVKVDYRTGDMVAPKLVHREPLQAEIESFVNCVRTRARPLADGRAGLRVVRILEAAEQSLRQGSRDRHAA